MVAIQKGKLAGKVAIVTGGASGIGEATARLFVTQGAHMVVIADIQDQLGQTVAASISLTNCSYFHCDVSDETQVQSLVDSTVKRYGQLDIMFSNAGITNSSQSILDLDLTRMDRLLGINVRGMTACVKHAARAMISGGRKGSIVCTASVCASKAFDAGEHDYCMSKHAVLGLVRSTSCELIKHGIRVNCVSPGAVLTPMLMGYYGYRDLEAAEKAFSSGENEMQGTVLKVDYVADAVLFLASDQSGFITGQDLVVDGGFAG